MIYTQVYETLEWPKLWASETVHLIPKNSAPDSLKQLRNLSCTPLFSKVLESFILKSLKESTKLSSRQFGGQKGSGVNHFLVETWNSILSSLEDSRASVQLMSIDFEKAFNRMDHNTCLSALKKLNASDADIELVACFLRDRTMSVKVGKTFSEPRSVPGGSPQGSILGNFLFCACTDEFTTKEIPQDQELIAPERIARESRGIGPDTEEEQIESEEDYDSDYEDGRGFRFFRKNCRRVLDETELSVRYSQAEIDAVLGVPENWQKSSADILAYIDDLNVVEKVRHCDGIGLLSTQKQQTFAHAPQSEYFFKHVTERASEMNMKVNEEKTQVLCISAAQNMSVNSYINASSRITSGQELKILGFWFDGRPNVNLHIKKTEEKFRKRLWTLRHLKRSGMDENDLIKIFCTVLRPVLDFASVVYHPMLTKEQSDNLENLQKRAFKIIFDYRVNYSDILAIKNVPTLTERREKMFSDFAIKTSLNTRFSGTWFPKKTPSTHSTRNPLIYEETRARTERLSNSPIFQMRKLLNRMKN